MPPVLHGIQVAVSPYMLHIHLLSGLLLFFLWCVGCSRTWDWEFTLTLQEGSVGVDELVRLDIANGDTGHDCGNV